jgi:hypothetical protein
MLIKKPDEIKSSEITDQKVYLNRRLFMRGARLKLRKHSLSEKYDCRPSTVLSGSAAFSFLSLAGSKD